MLMYYLQTIESAEDRSKFERIYLRYRKLMFYVARNILRNDEDAEDAVHQAFVSVIENLHKVRDPARSETRSYIDILRSREKIADRDYDDTIQGIEVPPPGTSDLADAMAKLPARYREILLLRYANGYSNAELGKMLNIKPGSVQKLLWRAKEMLKKALEKTEAFA